ncbi:GNAT superfamily N-acetyltransferase [Catenuloplanes nepalensis]|uniref:GNAT superfamily N-acetyltransferase n=1 Tax=Catenuloplanes nepalensis TaxID=587533 RepID=A0ABT9MVU7_9ACTN|nr:GNAT family N-acetyltransferase [Catenuloplanes nepalensis]MDP9795564.1 GNAT superfamily N-acetyltransferase [Catenuloplanes nepalensis]
MTILVRPVQGADADRVAELLGQLGYPADGAAVASRLDYWGDEPSAAVFVAVSDDVVVGVAAVHVSPLLEVDGHYARVVALVVDADARRGGIGRALMAAVEAYASAFRCSFVEVTSGRRPEREPAHRFYRDLGFEDLNDIAFRFRKPLPQ